MGWFKQRFDGIILVRFSDMVCAEWGCTDWRAVWCRRSRGSVSYVYAVVAAMTILYAMPPRHAHQKHATTAFFHRMLYLLSALGLAANVSW